MSWVSCAMSHTCTHTHRLTTSEREKISQPDSLKNVYVLKHLFDIEWRTRFARVKLRFKYRGPCGRRLTGRRNFAHIVYEHTQKQGNITNASIPVAYAANVGEAQTICLLWRNYIVNKGGLPTHGWGEGGRRHGQSAALFMCNAI